MKKWWLPGAVIGGGFALLASVFCPICAATIAVGLGVSRWLGVDDSVTSIWIGGLLVMLTIWTVNWLNKKYPAISEWWQGVIFVAYYLAVLGPLWWLGKLNHPLNRLWGLDKVLLGVTVGTIMVLLALKLHYWLKARNLGKSYFIMQRTIIVLSSLLITTGIFYWLTKN